MASETIVAVFNTADEAQNAIRALEAQGVPSSSIQQYARDDSSYADQSSTGGGVRQGFWSWLLGEEGGYQDHRTVYERTYESGGVVVTVIVSESEADRVVSTLEAHNPVDLDERTSQYGLTGAASESGTTRTDINLGASAAGSTGTATSGLQTGTAATTQGEQVVPLAEEQLEVGKRTVQKGAARVRRYVVERPVEEQIRLRNERISIERRPVSGSATVAPDAFTDKVVEVTETTEEPVVSKTARVVEEVVVGKEAEERTETVRDTVRREEVEIDEAGRSGTTTPGTAGTSTSGGTGTGAGTGTGTGTGTKTP
jgi:uncharacterized protein (TIGR02271 family)